MAKEASMKLSGRFFDSRIKSANIQKSESILGYFMGPCLVYMVYYCVAGSYLTQFYTDVLGITGIFLSLMPVVSKIVDAITNIVMGRIIDRTHTKQGKARPWILLSGILLTVTGVMLYAVPTASYQVQLIWIIVSYNLFFALAFTIYNMSHTLMVPLSTRNTKQRDSLAMLSNMAITMLPGLLVTIIMPLMIRAFGVGNDAKGTWITMMSIISILAIPATLLEYYFTKERVTEEAIEANDGEKAEEVSYGKQIKACFGNKYWLIIIGFYLVYNIAAQLSSNSMLYFCNWVMANSVDAGTTNQVLVNAIGQAPLGLGIFLLWPLVHKFGKRKVMMVGFVIGALGCVCVMLNPSNLAMVLGCMIIKSIGALPTYTIMAMLAEALDFVEWKNGYRADGFSASIVSIIIVVAAGIAQSIVLGGINAFGYITPSSTSEIINQPDQLKTFFTWCFVGVFAIGYLLGAVLMIFYDVENKIPQITAEIEQRHREEAEARGLVYVSPAEKAALEQEEQSKIAEENRIKELKARCEKKNLNFEEEEAKYQAKLAEAKAKEEAKKAKAEAKKNKHRK